MAEKKFSVDGSLFEGKVPIVIGVVGHRNIEQHEAAVAETARQECLTLNKYYPNTPFIVLSSLAEGADMVLAQVAMDVLGAKLFALLPLPPEVYEKDFVIEGSKAKYYDFLAKAACQIKLYDPADASKWSDYNEARNIQYAKAGGVAAEQSQVLFAVWDGLPARGTGGTAYIVDWFKHGTPKEFSQFGDDLSPLDPVEPGLLFHMNPKGEMVSTAGPTITIFGSSGEDADEATRENSRRSSIYRIFKSTNRFNRDIDAATESFEPNYPLTDKNPIPFNGPRDAAATYYAADALAIQFSNRVRRSDLVLYGAAVVAVFSFNLLDDYPVASAAYVGLTLVMFVAALYSKSLFLDNRFREYRALAEALRVVFFWRLGGVKTSVWLSYLSKHSGLVHWVRHSVRALEFTTECKTKREAANAESLRLVKEHWLKGQMSFYSGAGNRNQRSHRFWLILFVVTFGLSIIFALGFLYLSFTKYIWVEGLTIQWDKMAPVSFLGYNTNVETFVGRLQFVLGFVAALAITAKAFSARRAHLELMKQYASAHQTFTLALKALDDIEQNKNPNNWKPEQILREVGLEALQEHGEWLWLRHSRPFEPPTAT